MQLDKQATAPKWFPKIRIWIGLERYGVDGAAAVIEARVQELGGTPHNETLQERAMRQARAVEFKAERDAALNSREGVNAFRQGVASLHAAIKGGVDSINSGRKAHKLEFRESLPQVNECYVLGLQHGLSVRGRTSYANSLEGVYLEATLWHGFPPIWGTYQSQEPEPYITVKYQFDYLPSRKYVWKQETDSNRVFSSESLADEILKWLLDKGGDPIR